MEKFDLMETFFGQTSEMGQIIPNSFSPLNEPHTAKLSFTSILKHFLLEIDKKLLFNV